LSERNIVHRDLKPENVMIDEMGYPKLIDFGTAKVVEGRTFTIVGTPHYMAPEVISGKGYRLSADIWSIGIMLYEFMCGGVPFGEELEDSFKVYECVLTSKIIYPTSVRKIPQLTSLIDILLNRNAP
jgi:cGMP-dependent protein kinase